MQQSSMQQSSNTESYRELMMNQRHERQRATLFDYAFAAEKSGEANKFCRKEDLGNESSVEQFFVSRLLKDLGYDDREIRPKANLSKFSVARGRRKEPPYSPDYVMVTGPDAVGRKPRWLIDSKAATEDVDRWAYQGAGYALALNQGFEGEDPCKYYVITNGHALKVWLWNEANSVCDLKFVDFQDDNPSFRRLRSLLGADVVRRVWDSGRSSPKPAVFKLRKPSVEEAKTIFKSCHDLIWKAEKIYPQPAFFEFVKIMFVKLYNDKQLHEDPHLGPLIDAGEAVPSEEVTFSTRWIDDMNKQGVDNPIDDVKFKRLSEVLAEAVARGQKKPIFDSSEHITLQPGTIRQVVAKLERHDMFGIDEDLNGRLFETFLNATMRGRDLGQYFTPRSITKFMTKMATPSANRDRVDRIIDACCGSGGFLIEALTDMRNEIRANTSLSPGEGQSLNEQVANEALFGIDAGSNPPLARIARINMYLHGDGGSRIYAADGLAPIHRRDERRGVVKG